jgi:hypothetical protein
MATHHQPEEISTSLYNETVVVSLRVNVKKRFNGLRWKYTVNSNGEEIPIETEDGDFIVGVKLKLLDDQPTNKPVRTLPGTTVSSFVVLKN